MKRRANKINPWMPRLSAGGANRTNLNGAMSRVHAQQEEDCLLIPPPSRRPTTSGSDLMPVPRPSSFRPFNSCLQPVYHQSPPRYLSQWQSQPPPPSYIPPQYTRREQAQVNDKRRPIPRKGMFQNAKYSEAPPPVIDEDRIRETEEMITRIVEKSRRKGHHDYHPPNYAMRDSIRRAVYNLGVPENYRAPEVYYEEEDEEPEPTRRPRNPPHRREFSKHSKRQTEHEEDDIDEDDDEEIEDTVLYSPPKKKKAKEHKKKRPVEEYEDEDEEVPRRKVEKQRKKRLERKEGDTSDEETMLLERSRGSNHSNASRASKTKMAPRATEERPPSRDSKSSRNNTPKPPSPVAGPYIKDSDEDDNWRDSVPFMCMPNGAGAAMLERIGSAITTLPLRDDTTNSYSDVAMMLLRKSLEKLQNPGEERDGEEEGLQSQMMNMSTCWARNRQDSPRIPLRNRDGYRSVGEFVEEVVPETQQKAGETALMRDISRIQHPDNISTLQLDQSVLTETRLLDIDRRIEKDWNKLKKKAPMPPPLFQSSPKSNDVFRSNEFGITQPSSIRKGPEEYGICISDDEDDDPKQFDMDDYIARGASQFNYSYFPSDPDCSFFAPSNNMLSPIVNSRMSDRNGSRTSQNEKNIESSPPEEQQSPEAKRREFEIETSGTKSHNTTAEFNSRFTFSETRRKRQRVDMEVEESAQRMFDEVYESEQSDKQSYLF